MFCQDKRSWSSRARILSLAFSTVRVSVFTWIHTPEPDSFDSIELQMNTGSITVLNAKLEDRSTELFCEKISSKRKQVELKKADLTAVAVQEDFVWSRAISKQRL